MPTRFPRPLLASPERLRFPDSFRQPEGRCVCSTISWSAPGSPAACSRSGWRQVPARRFSSSTSDRISAGTPTTSTDEHGILIHKYGPHIFHTNSRDVFEYLSRFTAWRNYQHRVRAWVDGRLVPIPINLDTINRLYGTRYTSFELQQFFDSIAEPRDVIRTSEDVIISKVGRELYEKFFRNYTRKQWGLDPSELDATVIARIPVRTNRDDRYFTDTYQVMPAHGFTRMFERMLAHPNIKILLNTDYREIEGSIAYDRVVFTGPVDEYFDFRFGKLPYRSLEFKFETLETARHQPVAVVNYPNDNAFTRITEIKHITGSGACENDAGDRVSAGRRRALLSGSPAGERRALPPLSGAR